MVQKNAIEKFVENLIQQTAHQVLENVESAVGIDQSKSEVVELETYRNRVNLIIKQILNGYIYYYGS